MFDMFKFFWFKKEKGPFPSAQVPRSFTMASSGEENHIYRVSMEETYAGFVDVEYKKLSYAEAAALSKDKEQTSRVKSEPTVAMGVKCARNSPARIRKTVPSSPESFEDEHIQEKIKTNNYFLKNKVYKKYDRFPKRHHA